jgi:hypothetical protein
VEAGDQFGRVFSAISPDLFGQMGVVIIAHFESDAQEAFL